MENLDKPFWKNKTLSQMSSEEWESLCDGCGRCCLHKLEDEDSGKIYFTDVACHYLDEEECSCPHYEDRQKYVPDCLSIKPDWGKKFNWLPSTCAYRLLYEGKELPIWHPLISGDKKSVHLAGISVRGRTYRDNEVSKDLLFEHVINWVD
ncbi:MAG: putative cysteine cluster protein YcgN (CxxCxxCC family) [Brevundimonas sp.]